MGIDYDTAVVKLGSGGYDLKYFCVPKTYGNTAGPMSKPGMIAGQAFTTFNIEAWCSKEKALVFYQGNVIEIIDLDVFLENYVKKPLLMW